MKLVLGVGAAGLLAGGAGAIAPEIDPAGEVLYRQCIACHALEAGLNTPAGPSLDRIVGRPIAAEPGFNYSPALRRYGTGHERWSPELLDQFLGDPEAVVPGTEMGFVGLRDPEARRVLIDWLAAGQSGRD